MICFWNVHFTFLPCCALCCDLQKLSVVSHFHFVDLNLFRRCMCFCNQLVHQVLEKMIPSVITSTTTTIITITRSKVSKQIEVDPEIPDDISEEAREFLSSCLKVSLYASTSTSTSTRLNHLMKIDFRKRCNTYKLAKVWCSCIIAGIPVELTPSQLKFLECENKQEETLARQRAGKESLEDTCHIVNTSDIFVLISEPEFMSWCLTCKNNSFLYFVHFLFLLYHTLCLRIISSLESALLKFCKQCKRRIHLNQVSLCSDIPMFLLCLCSWWR